MTLKTKNIILNSSTMLCSVIFILHIIVFSLFENTNKMSFIVLFSNSLFIFVSSILVHIYYKKSLPSEIIFYTIFLVSFSFQSFRLLPLILNSETFEIKIIIGRFSLFCKYVGLLSLLGASLFSYTIKKQKIGTWMLTSILCAFVISSIMHFNTGRIQSNLLPKIIFGKEDLIITITIIIAAVCSFIKSGFDAKNREFFYMSIATILLTTSLMLSFVTLNLLTGIFMIILLIFGSIFYMRSMHNITLWG